MRWPVLLLLFLSGACALTYQVVWARMMTNAFGTTALAVGTVLAAFMSGLAAGSWLLGKLADRSRNPLRWYAYLEVGVGISALVAHWLLQRLAAVYVLVYQLLGGSDLALSAVRFVLAFLLVMAPTMLMGATLPVLSRFVLTRLSTVGAGLSTLYAINTVGAVAGTLLTGFYLIGKLGLHPTVYLASVVNVAIGMVALILSDRVAPPAPGGVEHRKARPAPRAATALPGPATLNLLLVAFAISGLTSFAYEIYWTRSLVFLLGNSTYAMSTMLTAFLSGIALGGYLVRFVVDRTADRVRLFGWTEILIGLSSWVALPLLFSVADPDAIRVYLGQASERVGLQFLTRFGLALLVMLVPATLIGATFPLVGRICVQDLGRTGRAVGRIYAVNTVGNVAGALLPGLVLLGWLGIQRGILAMAALNVCLGLALLLWRPMRTTALRWAMPAVLVGAGLAVVHAPLEFQFPSEGQSRWHRILFYAEGPSATTKVLLDPDTRRKSMTVDGVEIGGTGFTDFKQQLLAHLPKLLVDDVSVELSIGLGSGILVGESARHERVRRIVCVEIEPSVTAGAEWFAAESHGVLRDPRLEIVDDDVANHLRTTRDSYSVISADEKTAQDYASNGFSYSLEYYRLLRRRLAPRGLVVQWVPADLPPGPYAMVLKTFSTAFPAVQLWHFLPAYQNGPANTLLVGSNERISLDPAGMRRRLETGPPGAFAGLLRYGLTSAEAVLAHYVADGEAIQRAVGHAPPNTLDHPRYEYVSPRDFAAPRAQRLAANHDLLTTLRGTGAVALSAAIAASPRLAQALAAERVYRDGYRSSLAGAPASDSLRAYQSALALAPWNDSLRRRVFLHYWNAASRRFAAQDLRAAEALMRRAVSLCETQAQARVDYAIMLLSLGEPGRAESETRAALELAPQLVLARTVLADALLKAGRREEAVQQLQAVLEIEPEHALARQALGRLP